MNDYRIIVCGSRDWSNLSLMKKHLTHIVANLQTTTSGGNPVLKSQIVVVHGDARGADRMAEYIAKEMGLRVESHPANWDKHGKSAGPERNKYMLSLSADLVVAFKERFDWTFARGGTEHMIYIAQQANVPVMVIDPA